MAERPEAPPTPELDKMRGVHKESQAIGQFLDWLDEQGILLCKRAPADRGLGDDLWPNMDSKEELLARYYEIDLDKVEKERCALLDYQRALNEEG